MTWQLQIAKSKLSELLNRARSEGPQTITRHGKPEAVILSYEEYQRLASKREDLVTFLQTGADLFPEETWERDKSPVRDTDL